MKDLSLEEQNLAMDLLCKMSKSVHDGSNRLGMKIDKQKRLQMNLIIAKEGSVV